MELWPHSQSFVRRPCRRTTRPTDRPTNSGSASSVSSARARPCPSASAHCSPPPPPSKSKGSGLHVPDNLISHMEGKRDLREGVREGEGEMGGERWRERESPRSKALETSIRISSFRHQFRRGDFHGCHFPLAWRRSSVRKIYMPAAERTAMKECLAIPI